MSLSNSSQNKICKVKSFSIQEVLTDGTSERVQSFLSEYQSSECSQSKATWILFHYGWLKI